MVLVKTDVRYWYDAIFKPEYRRDGQKLRIEDWAARIQWCGRRETFNLKTSNKNAAAAKAKEIYTTLVGAGWDDALEKFKPEMQRKAVSTVGDFLTELRSHWSGKPKTFEDYCRSFRQIEPVDYTAAFFTKPIRHLLSLSGVTFAKFRRGGWRLSDWQRSSGARGRSVAASEVVEQAIDPVGLFD